MRGVYLSPGQLEQPAPRIHREVGVLEEPEQRQVNGNWEDEAQPAAGGVLPPQESEARQIAHRGRERHQQAKPGIPPAVEHISGDRQPDVPGPGRTQGPERGVRDGKKGKQEYKAVEEHTKRYHPPGGRSRARRAAVAQRRRDCYLVRPWRRPLAPHDPLSSVVSHSFPSPFLSSWCRQSSPHASMIGCGTACRCGMPSPCKAWSTGTP